MNRMNGLTIVKPVVYGHEAWHLTEKVNETKYQRTVYLRSYNNEDMSIYVKKVLFKLHESYAEPYRIVQTPPYTITETGWREFKIAIKIFFHDSNEKPVTIYHFLRFFDREENGNIKYVPDKVTSEFYYQIAFIDPTVKMYKLLTEPKLCTSVQSHSEEKQAQDLKKFLEAKQKVKQQIEDLKKKLENAKDDIEKMKKKTGQ